MQWPQPCRRSVVYAIYFHVQVNASETKIYPTITTTKNFFVCGKNKYHATLQLIPRPEEQREKLWQACAPLPCPIRRTNFVSLGGGLCLEASKKISVPQKTQGQRFPDVQHSAQIWPKSVLRLSRLCPTRLNFVGT